MSIRFDRFDEGCYSTYMIYRLYLCIALLACGCQPAAPNNYEMFYIEDVHLEEPCDNAAGLLLWLELNPVDK